jgi:thioredoxin-related protein
MVEKKCVIPIILLLIPLVSGVVNWHFEVDIDDACEMAKAENKLVLLYVYDEWTENADRILEDSKVSEYINSHFYAMKLYKFTSKAICEAYDIEKAPTVVFLDVHAEEIGRIEGFSNSEDFYNEMKETIEAKEFREKLRDEAYEALTNADSLYAKEKYKESKEQYNIALNKFKQLGEKEKEEYCKSKISSVDMKIQLDLLKYGLIIFVAVVAFFALIYYISAKK